PSLVPAERYLPGPVVDHELRAQHLLLLKQVVPQLELVQQGVASFVAFLGEVASPPDYYSCCWSVFLSLVPAERYLPGPVVDHDLRAPPLLLL
ncbi:MAG: hypothetical protein N2A40_07335, partial [Desulfobulbaceae bacterium]